MRPARSVEVDAGAASGDRLPIVGERSNYTFGEAAVAEVEGRRVHGVIGWDPRLGWVLVLDEGERPIADEA